MLRLFLKEIRYRWVIYVLTIFVISFIISILVVQSSVNTSAEDSIDKLSHKLGKNMLVLPQGTDLENFYMMKYGDGVMPEDYGERVKNSPMGQHVSLMEPQLYGNITVKDLNIILVGQRIAFPAIEGIHEDFAAVSAGAAQALGLSTGDNFDIEGNGLKVFTIINPPPKGFDMAIYVPLKVAQRILGKPGKINALYMGGCWCELDVAAFAKKVETMLPGSMAITIDGMAQAQMQITDVMKRYSLSLWIAGAILVTGMIIFLILYTIYKGGREIGLLLSIGLSPGRIVMKNITVSSIIAVSGAFLGYVLSVPLMDYAGTALLRVPLAPSWDLLPYFLGMACAIALIAALLPSLYVTRLDPTKLLREE